MKRKKPENYKKLTVHLNGNKYWSQNGLRHRDNDQPAVVYSYGEKVWYQNGEYVKATSYLSNLLD